MEMPDDLKKAMLMNVSKFIKNTFIEDYFKTSEIEEDIHNYYTTLL